MSQSDYLTLSALNNINGIGNVISIVYTFYDENLVQQAQIPKGGVGNSSNLIHIPIGPQNLIAFDAAFETYIENPANYPYYTVQVNWNGEDLIRLYKNEPCLYFEGKNFAFINKLGVFDYYRATLVDRQTERFDRKTYQSPYINYSTTTGTVDYSFSRRSETQYYASFQNNFEVETDWLDTDQSTWLFELFESPSVYVQQGSEFIGIIIENASEEYRTNPAGQRMFKYTIQYKLSNSKRSRT